jgi:hypothetical protein
VDYIFKTKPGQEFILTCRLPKDASSSHKRHEWRQTKQKRTRVQETSKAKWAVELLIDKAQLTRREKWEIKSAKMGARKQRPRIRYPLGVP